MRAEFDEEVLRTAVKRKSVLATLASEPHHRKELQTELELSKTTCHRIVRTFDERGLLRRTDSGYELTRLGTIVYEEVSGFDETVRTAYEVQPLLEAFVSTDVSFDVELFVDATITRPEPGDPYPFVDRTMELFRQSDTVRVVDSNQLMPPLYVEKILEIAIETGMAGEFVVTEEIALGNVQQFPDLQRQVAESAAASKYFVCEEIPFGMTIYDGHLDLRAYDDETGTPILYVDTDEPDAIEWARGVFDQYYDRADPASNLEEYPEWAPDTGIEDEV